jgi:hypothetical protein
VMAMRCVLAKEAAARRPDAHFPENQSLQL